MIPWTQDTFANGGILVDQNRPWAGRDKIQHVVAWAILARVEQRWLGWGLLQVILVGLGVAVAWECVEWARYRRWVARGFPQPQPENTDLPSWRDILAGMIGTALGLWVF